MLDSDLSHFLSTNGTKKAAYELEVKTIENARDLNFLGPYVMARCDTFEDTGVDRMDLEAIVVVEVSCADLTTSLAIRAGSIDLVAVLADSINYCCCS